MEKKAPIKIKFITSSTFFFTNDIKERKATGSTYLENGLYFLPDFALHFQIFVKFLCRMGQKV